MKSLESLQNSLYLAAKADSARKFYSLRDKICRTDVLYEAWKRVRQNKGTAGVDKETIQDIESHGVEQFILKLQNELRATTYTAQRVKRVFIPKRSGGRRPEDVRECY